MSTTTSPSQYYEELKNLNDQFFLTLDEYTAMYPLYKLNPDYEEYQSIYETDKGNMQTNKSDIFLLQNNLEKDIVTQDNNLIMINNQIKKLEKENKKLKKEFNSLGSQDKAALGAAQEYQLLYNENLGSIIGLTVATIATGVLVYYKNKSK